MELLRKLQALTNLPWLCSGDFIEVWHLEEKNRGIPRNLKEVVEFKEAIRDCELNDLGWNDLSFTWSNQRFRPHWWKNDWIDFLAMQYGRQFLEVHQLSYRPMELRPLPNYDKGKK